jgi:hypothetical protein
MRILNLFLIFFLISGYIFSYNSFSKSPFSSKTLNVYKYIDEFGDSTNELYIHHTSTSGRFSGVIGDNDILKVTYYFDKRIQQIEKGKYVSYFIFDFYEFGLSKTKVMFEDQKFTYKCKVKDSKGSNFKMTLVNTSSFFRVTEGRKEFYSSLVSATKDPIILKFSCVDKDNQLGEYRFTFDFENFNKALKIADIKLKQL